MRRHLPTELEKWKQNPLHKPLLLMGARQVVKHGFYRNLSKHGLTPYYWTASNGQSEIDFLVQYGMELIPIEVKAELNLTAKSLKSYCQKFAPGVAVRTSLANHHIQQGLPTATPDIHYSQLDIPLYALSLLIEELKSL